MGGRELGLRLEVLDQLVNALGVMGHELWRELRVVCRV